jgi:ABC-type Fe3+/spermidine/putrescine transport system ATPase subunit
MITAANDQAGRRAEKADAARDAAPRPDIRVQGVSKGFGAQSVLSETSFDIERGEIFVVLGPSGSGKTTLLRVIAGLERPEAGEVFLRGRRATALPPQERKLGVVFQEHALFPHMTVEENVAFGLKILKAERGEIRETVGAMLELVRLERHRRKYPAQLSGGQRQRVAVARALALKPDAMLFDEPFSALDAVIRAELRQEVRAMLKSVGMAALFITHDQEEALELGDRIALLNEGRMEQIGTPFDVYNHPSSEFVATFLGAANVLLGRWNDDFITVGSARLKAPANADAFADRQPVKLVFRPEDLVVNFTPPFLNTPHYLGPAVVEDVSYVGPFERLVVNVMLWGTRPAANGAQGPARSLASIEDRQSYLNGFPILLTRTKWEANDMQLSVGDRIVVGLKGFRVLPHLPLGSETGAKMYSQ